MKKIYLSDGLTNVQRAKLIVASQYKAAWILGPALGGNRPKVSPRLYGWVKGSSLFAENIADDCAKTWVERLASNGFTAFATEQNAIRPLVGGFTFETNGRVRTVLREIFFLVPLAILFAIVIKSGKVDGVAVFVSAVVLVGFFVTAHRWVQAPLVRESDGSIWHLETSIEMEGDFAKNGNQVAIVLNSRLPRISQAVRYGLQFSVFVVPIGLAFKNPVWILSVFYLFIALDFEYERLIRRTVSIVRRAERLVIFSSVHPRPVFDELLSETRHASYSNGRWRLNVNGQKRTIYLDIEEAMIERIRIAVGLS